MPIVIDENDNSLNTMREACIFTMIFILFILSWISVAVVGRAIDNFTFVTLGLNDKSTFHTVVIALVILAIEIAMIAYFNSINVVIYDSSSWGPTSTNDNTQTKHGDSDHISFSCVDQIMNVTKLIII